MADGTFLTTPEPWLQNFIISAQVCGSVFVPVCFVLLPDKTRESYDNMFSMLKEALEGRGLELSAHYFMSDFELAIRNSFTSHLIVLGSHFDRVQWEQFREADRKRREQQRLNVENE